MKILEKKYRLISKIECKLNEEERNHLNCLKCEYNKEQKMNILNKTLRELDKILEEVNKKDE